MPSSSDLNELAHKDVTAGNEETLLRAHHQQSSVKSERVLPPSDSVIGEPGTEGVTVSVNSSRIGDEAPSSSPMGPIILITPEQSGG